MPLLAKILQDCNIKLTSVLADIFGTTGRGLIEKIMDGEVVIVEDLHYLVKGRARPKIPQIVEAMNGQIRLHHRKMLQFHWDHIQFIKRALEKVEAEIVQKLEPYREEIELLDTIPGINKDSAAMFVAELGVDMSVFPTEKHVASWAGVCPGNHESAGKKRSSKATRGNKILKTIVAECALGSYRSTNRISAHNRRIKKRQGKMKSNVATAHLLIRIDYQVLKTKKPYEELGYDCLERDLAHKKEQKMIRYLRERGYRIQDIDNISA